MIIQHLMELQTRRNRFPPTNSTFDNDFSTDENQRFNYSRQKGAQENNLDDDILLYLSPNDRRASVELSVVLERVRSTKRLEKGP